MEDEYREKKFDWIDKEQERLAEFYKDDSAAAKWAAQEKGKVDQELFDRKAKQVDYALGQMGSAFTAIQSMYQEGSSEYARWGEAAKAMMIAQKALAVVQAVVAIATQGSGDPYTAFARIAAMAAAMGSLLASIGSSVSGGSSSASAPKNYSTGANGTPLGSEVGTGSESIANSYKLLQDTYTMENTRLKDLYDEMRSLNSNITGLVRSIVRTGGVTGMGIQPSSTDGWAAELNNKMFSIPGLKVDPLSTWVLGYMNKIVGAIFGGASESSVVGVGFLIGKKTVQQINDGMQSAINQYAIVGTKTSGGWFGHDKWSTEMVFGGVDSQVTDLFTSIFKNIGNTLLFLSKELGTDTQKAMDYIFEATTIDLTGMNTEQINKALQEYFSKISDSAVNTLFGDMLKGYQQVDEGLMETAVRLVTDKAIIIDMLSMTNQSFGESSIANIIKFSEAMIEFAGGLKELTEAAATYFDKFFTDAEKQARIQTQLNDAMASMGLALPDARDGYRDLVEGLDLTTTSGQAAYVTLLKLAGLADEYYKNMEESAISAKKASDDYYKNVDKTIAGYLSTGSIDEGLIAKLREIKETFTALTNSIMADTTLSAQALTGKLIAGANAYDAAVESAIQNIANSIRSKFDAINESIKKYNWDIANPGAPASKYFEDQAGVLFQSFLTNPATVTMETLSTMAGLITNWYQAKVAEETARAQKEMELYNKRILAEESARASVKALAEAIDATIKSIKFSTYNLALPTQKAMDAQTEYDRLKKAAFATTATTQDVTAFRNYMQTYLQQSQEKYKSTEKYLAIYAQVMKDLEDLKLKVKSASFEKQIVDELMKVNTNLKELKDFLKLDEINKTYLEAQKMFESLMKLAIENAKKTAATPTIFTSMDKSLTEIVAQLVLVNSKLAKTAATQSFDRLDVSKASVNDSATLRSLAPIRLSNGPAEGYNDKETKDLLKALVVQGNKRQNVVLTLENGQSLRGYVQATADELDQARLDNNIKKRNYR